MSRQEEYDGSIAVCSEFTLFGVLQISTCIRQCEQEKICTFVHLELAEYSLGLWFRNRVPTFAASTTSHGESGTTRPRCHIRVRVVVTKKTIALAYFTLFFLFQTSKAHKAVEIRKIQSLKSKNDKRSTRSKHQKIERTITNFLKFT